MCSFFNSPTFLSLRQTGFTAGQECASKRSNFSTKITMNYKTSQMAEKDSRNFMLIKFWNLISEKVCHSELKNFWRKCVSFDFQLNFINTFIFLFVLHDQISMKRMAIQCFYTFMIRKKVDFWPSRFVVVLIMNAFHFW